MTLILLNIKMKPVISPGVKRSKKPLRRERSSLTGCYVIQTSHKDLSACEIWELYHTLTKVEYAFRCLKTDLGMRPIHHQLADRTEAHLFISVLAYHLLTGIETGLREQGDTRQWSTIKKVLCTHTRSTIILHGEENKVYSIRLSSQPEPEQRDIYKKLGIKDPLKNKHTVLHRLNVVPNYFDGSRLQGGVGVLEGKVGLKKKLSWK